MNVRIRIFLLFFSIFSLSKSQTDENKLLLKQSAQRVYSYPDETIKTNVYLLTSAKSSDVKSRACHLISEAYFAKGNYEESLNYAFQSLELSTSSSSETVTENLILISEILYFLKLNEEAKIKTKRIPDTDMGLNYKALANTYQQEIKIKTKNQANLLMHWNVSGLNDMNRLKELAILRLTSSYLDINQADSAKNLANQALDYSRTQNLGSYWEIQSLLQLGKSLFALHKYNEAKSVLELASEKNSFLDNVFIESEIHQELSTNCLALNDNEGFFYHNQQALALENNKDIQEKKATNTAFELISKEQNLELSNLNKKIGILLYGLIALCIGLVILKIYLLIRNKHQLKTYEMFVQYLDSQRNQKTEAPIVPTPENRSSGLLKESEELILNGLRKFESTKKFTNKDMSLSLLASQLNTNTKYLSEVINRNKEKNFNAYINELRINYITDKIRNHTNYRNYKISYLAEESGFSSHSSFTTVFKSVVGISPIAFIDFVKKQQIESK